MGDEAGIAVEPGRGPLPDLPDALRSPWVQVAAFSHSASVGSRAPRERAKASASNQETWHTGASGCPVSASGQVRDVVVLLPRPALVAPPLAALVAAALGEVQPRRVGDRPARDAEGAELDAVAGALVVVGEDAVGGAERDGPGGDVEPLGRRVAVEGRKRRVARGQQPAQAHRLAHGLGVLELVAHDHLVHAPGRRRGRRCTPSVRSRTVGEVPARALGVEQLDLAAHGARRLERVVARGELGVQQRLAGEAVHEPEVLVGGDVPQVPRQRAHDRVDLALELPVIEVRDDAKVRSRDAARASTRGSGIAERTSVT